MTEQHKINCPECQGQLSLMSGKYGYFYSCNNYPACDVTQRCDQQTFKPKGIPVNNDTKKKQVEIFKRIKQLTDSGTYHSKSLHQYILEQMGTKKDWKYVYTTSLNTHECNQVLDILNSIR